MEKERYQPLLESEKLKIYQKKDRYLIVGEKEFTLQTNEKILKRPRKEVITSCATCGQKFNDDEVIYRVGKKEYHESCFPPCPWGNCNE